MEVQKQYNYCLDFIKGIACISVVFLHCEFPGVFGIAVQAISRWCVPFFFMVSGYYCYKDVPLQKYERIRKVSHIFRITLYSALFYILFAIVQNIIWSDVSLVVSVKSLLLFLCCNQMVVIVSQMWFLFALLYVYVVFFAIGSKEAYRKNTIPIAAICLSLYIVLAQGLHIVGYSVPNYVYKNWLIEGLGFFTLGHVIRQYQKKLEFKNSWLLITVVIFSCLSLVERYLLGRDFGVNISSIPQVSAIFLYAVNNPQKGEGGLQQLGKTCSMFVYILHPFVWYSLERVYGALHIESNLVALYLMPIIVLFLTIVLSMICYRVQTRNTIA